MYCSLEYIMFTSYNLRPVRRVILYCSVGWCVKGSAVHHCCQQCLVAEWLGLIVTVRVRVRARARKRGFSFLFFLSVLKMTNTFVLHVNGSCGVHGLRATTVRDITMYCKERYMDNVPQKVQKQELKH